MPVQHETTQSIDIQTQVTYILSESRPEQGYHFFVYRIKIHNRGQTAAKLLNRHWVITDAMGCIEEVRGPGVVGLQPKINPGQMFEYESACPLQAPYGSMKGHYQFEDETGQTFNIEIPEFDLVSPQALH
ncbi:MAG: Co2+/Mg2+ efflux protein ApaG [Pseudobdellovibrionaceae bacterium]